MGERIVLAFIPLFVAVDPFGMLPIFLALTEGQDREGRLTVARQAFFTALIVSLGFLLAGEFLFRMLHITAGDFLIAGGSILFVLAMRDLVGNGKAVHARNGSVGAVPLGTPLIAGPAVLTTSLVLVEAYGWLPTMIAIILNLLLAVAVFVSSEVIVRVAGRTGLRIVSRITALFLAAIGVQMVRLGIAQLREIL